jgi:hypothetical protein
VVITLNRDGQVPAFVGRPEQLLLLVTDCVRQVFDAGARRIEVATRRDGAGAGLEVSGDAPGPAEGDLALIRSLAQDHGGLTDVNWNPQTGVRIRIRLPGAPLN